MLVSFWSSSDIRTGVTTNAACISYFYARRYKRKVALFENHVPARQSLEDILIGKKQPSFLFEEPVYYNKSNSVNYVYGLLKSGMEVSDFSEVSIHMADGKLHYLPVSSPNHDLFDYELNKIIDKLLDELTARYEVVFVDLKRLNTLTTKRIVERSDCIFLNCLQDEFRMNDFLKNYSLDVEKLFFVISKLNDNSNTGFDNFLMENGIEDSRVSYIPRNEVIESACRNGSLSSFLSKNLWVVRGEKNFELISQIRKMTSFIKNRAAKSKGREEAI